MANSHTQNFFGQKTGYIFSTNSKEETFIYIRCLKKKDNGEWEKFNESKTIKLSLLEIISLLDVLYKKRKIWNTFHSFNDIKTPISFTWDENDVDLLWINIDNYSRPLKYPETELLKRLIEHIVNEKIEYSTIIKEFKKDTKIEEQYIEQVDSNQIKDNQINKNHNYNNGDLKIQEKQNNKHNKQNNIDKKQDIKPKSENLRKHQKNTEYLNKENKEEYKKIAGKIKINREKALLVVLDNNEEIWLPKSIIINNYDENNNLQNFIVKKWIFEKREEALS